MVEDYILCTISLAISYVSHLFVLIFVHIEQFQLQWREQDLKQMQPRIYRRYPLNIHNCRRSQSVVSNAKMMNMRFFVWWSFIFLRHHTPIKLLIMWQMWYWFHAEKISIVMTSMTLKRSHHLIKLRMLVGVSIQQRFSLQIYHRLAM